MVINAFGSVKASARETSRRLVWLANALLLAFALQVVLILITPHASLSSTVLALSGEIADRAFLPLLAVALIYGAAALDPDDPGLAWRCRREREVRALLGLFLLILALQPLAGWGELRRIQADQQRETVAIDGRLREVRRAILAASSPVSLLRDLEVLQAPALPQDVQQLPLPQLKRRLLASLDAAERFRRRDGGPLQLKGGSSLSSLLNRVLQTALLSGLYAVCITAGSPRLRFILSGRVPAKFVPRMSPKTPMTKGVDAEYFEALSHEQSGDGPQLRS